jgi:hypothetical protein
MSGSASNVAGGGGGGAGRIRINSDTAPTLAGIVSPAAASAATSTGPLPSRPLP